MFMDNDIVQINCDSESNLTSCKTHLNSIKVKLQQTPPYQHAQRIERHVRTINDSARTVLASLDYILPSKLYGELLLSVITNLNDFPTSKHPTLSPRIMVEGVKLNLTKRVQLPFGTIGLLHHAGKEQHRSEARSELEISLGPAVDTYGALRAFTFESATVVDRADFTPVSYYPTSFPWPLRKSSYNLSDVIIKSQEGANRPPLKHFQSTHTVDSSQMSTALGSSANHTDSTLVSRDTVYAPKQPSGPPPTMASVMAERDTRKLTAKLTASQKASPVSLYSDDRSAREGDKLGKRHVHFEELLIPAEKRAKPSTDVTYGENSVGAGTGPDQVRPDAYTVGTDPTRLLTVDENATPMQTRPRLSRRTPSSWKDGPARYTTRSLNKTYRVSVTAALKSDKSQESVEARSTRRSTKYVNI